MFSPSPDVSHNSHRITPNINIGQRRAAGLAERQEQRGRYISEDESRDDDEADIDPEIDDDWDHIDHYDIDVMGHDYREEDRNARRDLREAAFFEREQDALEIAHMERAVLEANRALDDAKRNLRETKMRIRDRRREERQQLKERSRVDRSVPEFARPFVGDVHERGFMRDYLSPAGNRSRPPTPQPFSSSLPVRSRSPSPYRLSSRTESKILTQPLQPLQSVHEPEPSQPRSRTPNHTVHKEIEADDPTSAAQEQVYQSFNKLHDLAKEFQALKQNFVYPSVLEFQKLGSQAGEVITVWIRSPSAEFEEDESISDGIGYEARGSEGKLAYTRANEALHTYAYAMEKLLGKLDSVDSWNETSVRIKRRGIVSDIEQEASKLERYRQKVWRDYLAQENAKVYG